jgi:hypothetical protein
MFALRGSAMIGTRPLDQAIARAQFLEAGSELNYIGTTWWIGE